MESVYTYVYDQWETVECVELEFEWDEAKAGANLAKHRVSFLTAAAILSEAIVERIDDRKD